MHQAPEIDNPILFSQPLAKSRPQPQVLVPLRGPAVSGFSSQPAIMSKFRQVQQRASVLTVSAKGAQAFTSDGQQNPDTNAAPLPSPQTQVAPVQNGKFLMYNLKKKKKKKVHGHWIHGIPYFLPQLM